MDFRITGLDPAPFAHLYGLDEVSLAAAGALRMVADAPHAFPDRVELRDLDPGEAALLVHYVHQPADTPFRAGHAIFVREGAERSAEFEDEVPEVMSRRVLSLRAFDSAGMMTDAALARGGEIRPEIMRLLAGPDVAYLQAHYAVRGCYAARVERA